MKFKNNTKWDTRQLRRIIAACSRAHLDTTQHKQLEVVANSVRAGGKLRFYRLTRLPSEELAVEIVVPNDVDIITLLFRTWCFFKRRNRDPAAGGDFSSFRARHEDMPLEEATVVVVKKSPLDTANKNLKTAQRRATEWKKKLYRAVSKLQDYEKKVKYYESRIVTLKEEAKGAKRKRKAKSDSDNSFTIQRQRRD
tara:strand:- start:559 stop:1146 length:588 start_codon:yes stop_codon:yes gene_type:complete